MNTVIIYSSKYGCAEDCAKQLKSNLTDSAMLIDINKSSIKTTDLESYDKVILGSSIYMGAISKKMRSFCKENVNLLSSKKVGIFICCAFEKQIEVYLQSNFPALLLKSAAVTKSFGGESRPQKMKPIDKLIMKIATKGNSESMQISKESITSFANIINQ